MARWRGSAVALLILAVGLSGGTAAETQTADSQAPSVRVMSFNLRYGRADDGRDSWEHRVDLVGDVIRNFDPDLLGLQESLAFQGEYVAGRLPGHGFVGVGRDDGDQGGEMCAVLYRTERFELIDSGHFWLSETPDVVASRAWDAALTRMATWVILRTRSAAPDTFVFINTHFDHIGETARLESAKVLTEQLAGIAGDLPVILTGDFNAPADASQDGPYRVLTRRLVDTYRAVHEPGPTEGTFNGFEGTRDGARIDWILVTPDWRVRRAAIERSERRGRFPSDHFPVTAVLERER